MEACKRSETITETPQRPPEAQHNITAEKKKSKTDRGVSEVTLILQVVSG